MRYEGLLAGRMTRSNIVGIVGAGQMGKGIAQVAAQSGFAVVVVSTSNEEMMQKARVEIDASLVFGTISVFEQ